jgi:hypothetical protein
VIALADAKLINNGSIELTATAFDPDGDGITIRYEQIAGPFAVQKDALTIAGAFNVTLSPSGNGIHSFRIIVSDGFFSEEKIVSTDVRPTGPLAGSILFSNARPIPSGNFDIRLSGDVAADSGVRAFVLDGQLSLAEIKSATGPARLRVSLATDQGPFFSFVPGAIRLDPTDAVGPRDEIPEDVRDEPSDLDGLLTFEFRDAEILITGPARPLSSAGAFRAAGFSGGPADIATAMLRLRILGDQVTGTVRFASSPMTVDELPRFADYEATVTGTRR